LGSLPIAWFAAAARRWFPLGAAHYDEEIARLADRVERVDAAGHAER
jgi:hypothetical protein